MPVWCPFSSAVRGPSGCPTNFAGPVLTVTLFPLAGFVKVSFKAPVDRKIVDPSAASNSFWNCLLTSCVPWISNPQTSAPTVKVLGRSRSSHPSPRPPARAGVAAATPPSMLSSAPSATITPNRLTATTPLVGQFPQLSAAQMFTRMWFTFSEVRLSFASTVPVTGPAVANMPGSPVSCCSAGERSAGPRPVDRKLEEPSALKVTFAGPEVFTVTLLPFAGFEKVIFAAPVNRKIEDPSVVLSSLTNTLSTSCVAWTRNPQFVLSKPGKKSRNCHPSPLPPARAGEAVTTPPNMLSSAPSATITPIRLMAIPPIRATALWPGAGHIVQPQDWPRYRWPTRFAVPLVGSSVNDSLHLWG